MKTFVLDTNGFLRWLLNDVISQAEQVNTLLLRAQKGHIRLILPQIVVFEISFALEKFYGKGKSEVIPILQTLLSTEYLDVEEKETFLVALKKYQRYSVSLVDCFLLAQAEVNNATLFTFDKKLQKLAQ